MGNFTYHLVVVGSGFLAAAFIFYSAFRTVREPVVYSVPSCRPEDAEARMRPAVEQCHNCKHACEYRGCAIDRKVTCPCYAVKDGNCENFQEVEA